ncbi:helix-turn-helix transcriptional regulator [Roseovarius sp. THAF8]|uniref:helix-turn-helix transcriptional regulator n=1 Tax=Roseovarius sp. THAF8 TaxID=2587846 RepID=UPI0034A44F1F
MGSIHHNKDALMTHQTYLSDKQAAARYAVDRAAIWRWCKADPDFPTPVKLTPGTTRWRLSDLEAWEALRAGGGGEA